MDGLGKVWSYNSNLTQWNWNIWGKSKNKLSLGVETTIFEACKWIGEKVHWVA
jgi:hypothetical protein